MISFRYHVVSTVAVLLALALGVLVGASVLDKGLVEKLRDDTEQAQALADELQARVGVLDDQMDAFASEVLPSLAGARLEGEHVILVVATSAPEGADDPVVAGASRALDVAGADVEGVLYAGARIAAEDAEARTELADILGRSPDADPDELSAEAGRQLGARLAGVTPRGGGGDLLTALIERGFLCPRGCTGMTDAVVAELGSRNEMVVVVGGEVQEPVPAPDAFAVPMVEELVNRGVDLAAAEGVTADYSFVEALRSDGPAEGERIRMVTVDDLDEPLGEVALVLGLEHLSVTGTGGNYGVKPGNEGHLPVPA